jgi:hypothetical protein
MLLFLSILVRRSLLFNLCNHIKKYQGIRIPLSNSLSPPLLLFSIFLFGIRAGLGLDLSKPLVWFFSLGHIIDCVG